MKRYILLLCGLILFAGCDREFVESRELGNPDSTSMAVSDGRTVKVVHIGGNDFVIQSHEQVRSDESLYYTRVMPRGAINVRNAHTYLCRFGAIPGQTQHNVKTGEVKYEGYNLQELCHYVITR